MKELNPEIFRNQRFLFVFDLDGTLLNSKQEISPLTAKVLHELQKLGNIVTIASGRPKRAIYPYYHALGLTGPFICYNGAMITNPDVEGFEETHYWIPKDVIHRFFRDYPEESFVNYMIEDETDQFYFRKNDAYTYFFHPEGMKIHLGKANDIIDKDVMTCVIQGKDTSRNKELEDYVEKNFPEFGLRFWMDSPRFGEFYHRNHNKSTGIDELVRHYHLDRAHVIAFGDAMNDAQMLSRAGISFAMTNGAEPLKHQATYVTRLDNDHDGIADSLLDLFAREI